MSKLFCHIESWYEIFDVGARQVHFLLIGFCLTPFSEKQHFYENPFSGEKKKKNTSMEQHITPWKQDSRGP